MEQPEPVSFTQKNERGEDESIFGERFVDNEALYDRMRDVLVAINTGNEDRLRELGAEKVIKTTETGLTAASANDSRPRYRIGSTLITYKGVNPDGSLEEEIGEYRSALLKEKSVIASNGPILYPEGHPQAGKPVMGHYEDDGSFVIDANGTETAENEYVMERDIAEAKYGFDGTSHPYRALVPSYRIPVPDDAAGATLRLPGGAQMELYKGGDIIFSTKNGQVHSWGGLAPEYLHTYENYDEWLKQKGETQTAA